MSSGAVERRDAAASPVGTVRRDSSASVARPVRPLDAMRPGADAARTSEAIDDGVAPTAVPDNAGAEQQPGERRLLGSRRRSPSAATAWWRARVSAT